MPAPTARRASKRTWNSAHRWTRCRWCRVSHGWWGTQRRSSATKEERQMSETKALYGEEHVQRYRETGGEVGHIWKEGSTVLLLTTKGRKTGKDRTTPLIYARDGDRYVIVASKGGAPEHPGWYRNLQQTPEVELQV